MESQILAAMLQSRQAYDTFKRFGNEKDFSPIANHIFRIVEQYFAIDARADTCPRAVVQERAGRELTNPKHARAVEQYLADLPDDVSLANVEHDIREQRRAAIGDRLALALANKAPDIQELLQEYKEVDSASDCLPEESGGSGLIDIFDTSDLSAETIGAEEELFILWPKELNDRCDGGAKRGHHILLFGRPESGKTLVAINMVAGFLHKKLNALFVSNEEPAADIRARMRQRLLKLTKEQVRNEPQRVTEALANAKLGRLRIAPLTPGTFPEIQRLIEETKPDVLVLDQLRNIRVSSATRVEELEQAATEARNLAKRNSILVVSITQAGDSATNKTALELNDVDGSKTGIPAQMDLMVGVGSNEAMRQNGMLTLSLPKNKLSGDHSSFSVSYNKQTGVIQ